jgi:hypothetical protein
MIHRTLVPVLALLACGAPAMAQESGGLRLAPGIGSGPVGLARPLAVARTGPMTAQDAQNGMTPASHQAQNQATITRLQGDPGFLSGFSFGTPLAASRQPWPFGTPQAASGQTWPDDGGYWRRHGGGRWHGQPEGQGQGLGQGQGQGRSHGRAPVIINNDGPLAVTVGNGNVVQQQSATGSGPIALQQVATTPGAGSRGGGAVNLASNSGSIQRAPGGN